MTLPIARRWFDLERLSDGITRIWEPHVIRVMQCNIWHVRGRDRDLLIDTGMGIASLHEAAQHLFDKALTAVATHTHLDHVGSLHEFPDPIVHVVAHHRARDAAEVAHAAGEREQRSGHRNMPARGSEQPVAMR